MFEECSTPITLQTYNSISNIRTKRKKTKLGYVPLRYQPLETWTHEVCVLRCDEDTTPTRERLEELTSAGLGKAKLVFPDKKADHNKALL